MAAGERTSRILLEPSLGWRNAVLLREVNIRSFGKVGRWDKERAQDNFEKKRVLRC